MTDEDLPVCTLKRHDIEQLVEILTWGFSDDAVQAGLRLSTTVDRRVIVAPNVSAFYKEPLPASLTNISVSIHSVPLQLVDVSQLVRLPRDSKFVARLLFGQPARDVLNDRHMIDLRFRPFSTELFINGVSDVWVAGTHAVIESFLRQHRALGYRLFTRGRLLFLVFLAFILAIAASIDALAGLRLGYYRWLMLGSLLDLGLTLGLLTAHPPAVVIKGRWRPLVTRHSRLALLIIALFAIGLITSFLPSSTWNVIGVVMAVVSALAGVVQAVVVLDKEP